LSTSNKDDDDDDDDEVKNIIQPVFVHVLTETVAYYTGRGSYVFAFFVHFQKSF